jgi:uncharacterized YccA/Bax inhibitor family protein
MGETKVFGRIENAVLNLEKFQKIKDDQYQDAMTVRGVVSNTVVLLTIVIVSAVLGWISISSNIGLIAFILWIIPASIGVLVVALITGAKMQIAPYTAPIYAFLEGSILGGYSAIVEMRYPGIAIQAVFLTFGTLLGLLIIYRLSGFHVTAKFRVGVASATIGILIIYCVNFCLHLLGLGGIFFLHEGSFIGLCLSLFVVAIAALNLVLDFDLIENGAREGAPKYMEWYCAFGLLVTLIWIYLEVLKFLLQIAASDNDQN